MVLPFRLEQSLGKVDSEVQVHVKQEIPSQEISSPATDPSHRGAVASCACQRGRGSCDTELPEEDLGSLLWAIKV